MSICVRNGRHEEPTVARRRAIQRVAQPTIETQHDGDGVIVALGGEIDLAIAAPLREALTSAIGETRQRVIIDLAGVTFIDSTGLHAILDAYVLCRELARTLTIRPGPPNVQRIFELTRVLDQLPFEKTS
jgi:anti-sigma B factor antagonist